MKSELAALEAEISYQDGAEQRVLELLRKAPDLSSSTAVAADAYGDFLVRYHLCTDRSVLLRPFRFTGLRVLELGAGMGGVSRFVAEECAHLTVVEGTQARLDACRERLRDLGNWTAYAANLQDFTTEERFDVVLLIGVLEYSDCYVDAGGHPSAFHATLAKASSLLTQDGVLFVAIENKLGLKYWSGATEDHSAWRFNGIAGYASGPVPRTFSRKELQNLLRDAGFAATRAYFPAADYKIPHSVLSAEMLDRCPEIAAEVMSLRPAEDYLARRVMMFPDDLALETIAGAGLLAEFANSFLFAAARDAASDTLARVTAAKAGEIGWHYTISNRRDPTVTVFHRPRTGQHGIEISKARLFEGNPAPSFAGHPGIVWQHQARQAAVTGSSVMSTLRRHAYYGQWPAFEELVERFLMWSFDRWSDRGSDGLDGHAIDATVSNALLHQTAFKLFDQEWSLATPFPGSWFILRNVLALHEIRHGGIEQFPYPSLQAWYAALCNRRGVPADIDADLEREIDFQTRIRVDFDPGRERAALLAVLGAGLPCVDMVTTDEVTKMQAALCAKQVQLDTAQAEIALLHASSSARLTSRPFRWAARLVEFRVRHPRMAGALRRMVMVLERF